MGRGRGGRGGGKRNRTQARDFKEKRENVWRSNSKPNEWQTLDMNNADFEAYYKAQKIVPDDEWEAFMASLRSMLPTTFRINGSGKFAEDLRNRLQTDFLSSFGSGPMQVGGEDVQPPQPLPWYPRSLAWQMAFSRAQLRKLDALTQVHEFMKRENEGGGITRQEAVSMIPPLFLDVQPHHLVLDMCAAPGSKTFQLLEALHADSNTPTGVVIANDADAQRCNLLTHQVKRMCSPALMVSNHEAQLFPLINEPGKGPMLFDRILCDVPCSGDGTIRKAPDIWRKWTAGNGNGLHPLQLRITLRACALLQVGGTLVYSTCTFNPVEDEAVVAEVLRRTGGSMELLDVSAQLPELRRVPGLCRWVVKDHPRSEFLTAYSQCTPEGEGRRVDPSMFPDAASDEFPLERCMRVLPHHSDTGGFFVAVLRKTRNIVSIAPVTLAHRVVKGREGGKAADSSVPWPGRLSAVQDLLPDAPATATPQPVASMPATVSSAAAALPSAAAVPTPAAADALHPAAISDTEAASTAVEASIVRQGSAAASQAQECAAGVTTASASLAAVAEGLTDVVGGVGGGASALAVAWGLAGGTARAVGGGTKWMGLDPVVPVTSAPLLQSIASFYGLGSPEELKGQLVTRNAEHDTPKRLYIVGPAVGRLLAADERPTLKVTATGVKAFERQESKDGSVPCAYRIAQEGLPLLLPFITRQRVTVAASDFLRLLTERSVPVLSRRDAATDPDQPITSGAAATAGNTIDPELSGGPPYAAEDVAGGGNSDTAASLAAEPKAPPGAGEVPVGKGEPTAEKPKGPPITDEAALQQLALIGNGCCVVTLRDEEAIALGLPSGSKAEGALAAAAPLALSCWRGRASLNILVSKPECAQVAEKLRRALGPGHGPAPPPSPLNPNAQVFTPAAAAAAAGSVAEAKSDPADSKTSDSARNVGEKRNAEPHGSQSLEGAPEPKVSKTDL